MGDCRFCGSAAGFLHHEHETCREQHDAALGELRVAARDAALGRGALEAIEAKVSEIASRGFLSAADKALSISQGFGMAVDEALADRVLTEEEDQALGTFIEKIGQQNLDFATLMRVAMAGALHDVMNGKVPERLNLHGDVPFNLESKERLVWLWGSVDYGEEVTHRRRVGGYGGPSVRIARGVYWHMGGFASQTISSTAMELVDKGGLAATTEHLYFKGQHRALKIPYNKIVAWEQYSDGLGIEQGNKTSRPQVFKTGDGWFAYNLVRNLAQHSAEGWPAVPSVEHAGNVITFPK